MAAKKKSALTKKQQKQIKKFAKKNPKVFIITVVVLALLVGLGIGGYLLYKHFHKLESGEVQIHFLELGNSNIGDATYIQVGDIDILIDAGSRKNSAKTIEDYLKSKMSDKKLEYVIATHAHEDHIAGFVGTSDYGGIFDHYAVDNLIQFARTDNTSALYVDYSTKVESLKNNGTKVYTADQCVDNPFKIAENITLKILDQKYYHEKSSTENNYSVCALLTQGNNNYLFTGDLEKSGEESLVEKNPFLPHCQLFKGGHHGSITSSNECLLEKIRPEVVCFCTCCGSEEYGSADLFPNQVVLDRIGIYTNKLYATGSIVDGEYKSLNGIITFICKKGSDYSIDCSNDNKILKDTDWFKKNRVWNGV